jgi:hypothetical protein
VEGANPGRPLAGVECHSGTSRYDLGRC